MLCRQPEFRSSRRVLFDDEVRHPYLTFLTLLTITLLNGIAWIPLRA